MLDVLLAAPNPAEVSNDHFQIIVGGIVSVLISVLGLGTAYVTTTGRRTKRIEEQVANNHKHPDGTPINLRDESDERHAENGQKLDWLIGGVLGLQQDVKNLYARDSAHDSDIRRIEDTLDHRPSGRHTS